MRFTYCRLKTWTFFTLQYKIDQKLHKNIWNYTRHVITIRNFTQHWNHLHKRCLWCLWQISRLQLNYNLADFKLLMKCRLFSWSSGMIMQFHRFGTLFWRHCSIDQPNPIAWLHIDFEIFSYGCFLAKSHFTQPELLILIKSTFENVIFVSCLSSLIVIGCVFDFWNDTIHSFGTFPGERIHLVKFKMFSTW